MDSIFLSRDVDFTKKFENGNPSIYRKRNVEKLHISSLLTSKDVGNINLIKKNHAPFADRFHLSQDWEGY